ncbi:DnaJ domain-containing protein [Alkalinema sp. FACHB-956]|uniref:J domain-containing protein n=1 Tax=Alkalinema sp. FACHB-956 TaxID=2692768 RepID=UPI0016868DCB|nr:DnaJ domain-containing protein [Alkalinema sp. FACHB-956]MBD2328772.1 DnaJ domain-containing protein [Alkalinema sp. FACHB-956]
MATATQSRKKKAPSKTEKSLNSLIQNEIARLSEMHGISQSELESFAQFVIANYRKIDKRPKPLKMTELKQAIFNQFSVTNLTELRKSGSFQLATSSLGKLDLSKIAGWEILYRKLIGVLPHEVNEQGYGCINGINIFNYDMPWQAFGLNPQTATTEQIKSAYRDLSRIYHPDNRETGDAKIFDRLTIFYKSLTETF